MPGHRGRRLNYRRRLFVRGGLQAITPASRQALAGVARDWSKRLLSEARSRLRRNRRTGDTLSALSRRVVANRTEIGAQVGILAVTSRRKGLPPRWTAAKGRFIDRGVKSHTITRGGASWEHPGFPATGWLTRPRNRLAGNLTTRFARIFDRALDRALSRLRVRS